MIRPLILSAAALCLLAGTSAQASTVIDFEAQAAAAGNGGSFTGTTNSPLTIGIATFSGGELLLNETFSVDETGVYATASLGGGYTNPLPISFSQGVSGFSLLLTNNNADTFTVADNLGDSESMFLAANSMQTFTLAGTGITSVTVTEAGSTFDYAIDNVTFTAASTTPEPSSLLLLGSGLLAVGGVLRRRFA
jgi:hypothetical protein